MVSGNKQLTMFHRLFGSGSSPAEDEDNINAHREDASSNGAEEDEMQMEEDGEEFAEEEEGYGGMEKNIHQGDGHHTNKEQTMTISEYVSHDLESL